MWTPCIAICSDILMKHVAHRAIMGNGPPQSCHSRLFCDTLHSLLHWLICYLCHCSKWVLTLPAHLLLVPLQQVGADCREAFGSKVEVLPLDVCAPFSELHSAAVKADAAFEGAGIDYFVHCAGVHVA